MKYLSQFVQILLLAVGIFSYQSLFSQTTTFDSSTTYTIPAGVTQIKVEAWGGGGRGGSRASGSDSYGGGGGGGAYASRIINVTPLTTYTVTVGTGSNNNGNPGGDSWFSPNNSVLNALVLAKGGSSVPNNSTIGANGGNYAECIGDIRNNGGRGANGSSAGGGGGASAGSLGIGPSAINEFGAIAATGADGTGGNGQIGNGNGSAGSVPGGGGGGARRTSGSPTGGTGANGRIIITILGPQFTTTITGDTTWVAPAGVTAIEVEAWGAGGRGGQRSNNGRGGGGGGGAYSRGLVSVTPGQTYYINVGAGSTTTNAGQSSWFNATNVAPNSDNFVLAVGGSSAPDDSNNGATGGSLTNGYGNQEKRSGGNGANSTGSSTGGGGASAGSGANGGNAVNGTGGIAPVGGGNGANGHNSNDTNGYAGVAPGGGGSGARRGNNGDTRLGGAGANGQVIIHTFYNLAIQKTVNTTTPLVGSNVTFTISVTNTGTNTARGVSVLDQIPTGLTFVSASTPTQGTFNTANLTWTIGELAPSASAAVTLTATVNATGNYTNRAILSANLTNQSSNTSAVTVFPQQPTSDLQIIKEVDSSMSLIGDEVVFTLTAYNAGPQNATGVTVQDILPLGFTYVSTSGAYDANSGIWTVGNLNSGASTTLTITAIINPTGNHYNQATISGNQTDPNLSNNSSAIMVYPMYPITEIVLPCGTMNYDLSSFDIGTPPPGAEISWHTSTPADDSNKVMSPTNTEAGKTYYVAFYDPVQNCYGSTSVVKITRSCLITNPMIRQQVR